VACTQMPGSILLDFTTCINERRNGTTAYSSDLFDRIVARGHYSERAARASSAPSSTLCGPATPIDLNNARLLACFLRCFQSI